MDLKKVLKNKHKIDLQEQAVKNYADVLQTEEKQIKELEAQIKLAPDAVLPWLESNRDKLKSTHNISKSNHDTAVNELKAIVPTIEPEVPGKMSTSLPQLKSQTEAVLHPKSKTKDTIKLPTKAAKPTGSKLNDQGHQKLDVPDLTKGKGFKKFKTLEKKGSILTHFKFQTEDSSALHSKSQTKDTTKLWNKAARSTEKKIRMRAHQHLTLNCRQMLNKTVVQGSTALQISDQEC